MSHIGTQQECRRQVVHRDAADVATSDMTQDAHLKVVRKTGSTQNKKQHVVGCEYMHIKVNGCQLTVSHTAGACRELRDQFIAVRNGKPPWFKEGICLHSPGNRTS